MATTLRFDNLNVLDSKVINVKGSSKSKMPKPIPYREYFGEMYITPDNMKNRIRLAEEIEDVMLYVFAYWLITAEDELSEDELRRDAKDKLTSVIAKHSKLDEYLEQHINKVVDEVIDTTEKHTGRKKAQDAQGDVLQDETLALLETSTDTEEDDEDAEKEYWTSRDRAMLIAENEANAFYNYEDYREAKLEGKTQKTWITELDDKVRLTHTLVEGKTVDIDGLFFVGDSLMRFPKDTYYDPSPKETVNCRCSVLYK